MKNNSFPYPAGPGNQPIRVLHPLILGLFENASADFLGLLSEQIEYFGANPSIAYDIAPSAIAGPYIEGVEGTIHLQESFLSYLWAITYSHLVVVDEEVTRPQIEDKYVRTPIQAKLIDDAYNLLIYGLTIREYFTDWDTDSLPNPEKFSNEEAHYIEKSSAVFVQAIVFILIHEFAHFYLGHLDATPSKISAEESNDLAEVDWKAESRGDETKADSYAISVMKDGVDFLVNKQTVYCGIVIGLVAVLFLHNSLDGDTHPDPHQRLYGALVQMDLEPNNMLWALASTAVTLWVHFHRKPRVGGHDYNSLRENFEKMMEELSNPDFFISSNL